MILRGASGVNVQAYPRVVSDGAGGAIITWQDLRGGVAYDLYAQHVQASGFVDPAWPTDGAALCQAALRLPAPYPSPSGGEPVTIVFDLPSPAHASAQVFDAAGHRVRSLMLDGELPAGRQILRWDGRNDQLHRVPPGIYFVRIRAAREVAERRMVVLE